MSDSSLLLESLRSLPLATEK